MALNLNIKHALFILLAAALAAIFLLKPHRVATVDKKGIPQIVFFNFESFEITKNGVESVGRGMMAERFSNVMKVKDPYFKRLAPHGVESIAAKEALYRENRNILFTKSVVLLRDDGWKILTERINYDIKKGNYSTQGYPFTAYYGKSVVRGKNMVYYQKSGKIRADSIKADIETEDI